MSKDRDKQQSEHGRGGSPGSGEARQQQMAGNRGPEAGQSEGVGAQPPQGSQRAPAARHQTPAEERTHFEPGHAPSEQGEKEHPSPHVIAQHQQGMEPRSGNTGPRSDQTEELAESGEPRAEHTRHGRHDAEGDRKPNA